MEWVGEIESAEEVHRKEKKEKSDHRENGLGGGRREHGRGELEAFSSKKKWE